jgi:hypothetical protein
MTIAGRFIYFRNYQDKLDPNNGRAISSADELATFLDQMRTAIPFIAHFSGPADFRIEFGIGGDFGCVQISRMDDDPPYLMAVSADRPIKSGDFEFLCGNTPTPIPARHILSFEELKQIVLHFLATGERSNAVSWESI